ncbi:MAG: DUF4249 family protein, partial [Bacteroidales bacterium]|nr:DUF4249 family protein [Bacteroidales bacterium]
MTKHNVIHIKRGTFGLIFMAGMLLMNLSCTENIDWDLKYQPEDLIVVEGKITDDIKSHEVKLTFPVYEINGIPEPVTGAMVVINDGRTFHFLPEDPSRPG